MRFMLNPNSFNAQQRPFAVKLAYGRVEGVKVYKHRCIDLKRRCSHLVRSLKAEESGLEGSRVVHFAHEVEG